MMNFRLTQWSSCCGVICWMLLQATLLHAQNRPFQMAGLSEAPQGISLVGLSPHNHIGGGNILGPHQGAGSFTFVGAPIPSVDVNGNLVALTALFTSGPNGYHFTTSEGTLATDYGVGPAGVAGAPGTVVLRVRKNEWPILVVSAQFVANFEVDPDESTGKFAGATGRWLMDAKSTRPFRLNLSTGTSEPFRFIWRSRPGTGSVQFP